MLSACPYKFSQEARRQIHVSFFCLMSFIVQIISEKEKKKNMFAASQQGSHLTPSDPPWFLESFYEITRVTVTPGNDFSLSQPFLLSLNLKNIIKS